MPVLILAGARRLDRQGCGFSRRRRRLCGQALSPGRGGDPRPDLQARGRPCAGADQGGAAATGQPAGRYHPQRAALRLTGFETRILAYLIHHQNRVAVPDRAVGRLYDAAADRDFNHRGGHRAPAPKDREGLIETRRGQRYKAAERRLKLPRDSIRARLIGLAMMLTGMALVAGYLVISTLLEDFHHRPVRRRNRGGRRCALIAGATIGDRGQLEPGPRPAIRAFRSRFRAGSGNCRRTDG